MLPSVDPAASLKSKTQPATANDQTSLMVEVKEFARLIDVSPATLWRMRSASKLPPAVKLSAGCVRWRRADIQRWVDLGCPTQQQFLELSK